MPLTKEEMAQQQKQAEELLFSGPQTLGFAKAAKMVAESRWAGCWLGVRTPGRIAAGDPFELVPGPRATGLVELFRTQVG